MSRAPGLPATLKTTALTFPGGGWVLVVISRLCLLSLETWWPRHGPLRVPIRGVQREELASGGKPIDLGSDPFWAHPSVILSVRWGWKSSLAAVAGRGEEQEVQVRGYHSDEAGLCTWRGGGGGGRDGREESHATFSIALPTSARGQGPESQGAGPVTPGHWSAGRIGGPVWPAGV